MALDFRYKIATNEIDAEGRNYQQVQAAWPKALRLITMERTTIDGEAIGNLAWTELARSSDDTDTRAKLVRYTTDALLPLVRSGEIRDLVVAFEETGLPGEIGMHVSFFDVTASNATRLAVTPPWTV
jgi:hypothetical protein